MNQGHWTNHGSSFSCKKNCTHLSGPPRCWAFPYPSARRTRPKCFSPSWSYFLLHCPSSGPVHFWVPCPPQSPEDLWVCGFHSAPWGRRERAVIGCQRLLVFPDWAVWSPSGQRWRETSRVVSAPWPPAWILDCWKRRKTQDIRNKGKRNANQYARQYVCLVIKGILTNMTS